MPFKRRLNADYTSRRKSSDFFQIGASFTKKRRAILKTLLDDQGASTPLSVALEFMSDSYSIFLIIFEFDHGKFLYLKIAWNSCKNCESSPVSL